MLKRMKPSSITYVAYVLLLLAAVALGLLVAALALGSELAALAGAFLVITIAMSVIGFRLGASRLAQASESAGSTHKLSFWADQLEQDRIDRYRSNYRGEPEPAQPQYLPDPAAVSAKPKASPAPCHCGRRYGTPAIAAHRLSERKVRRRATFPCLG